MLRSRFCAASWLVGASMLAGGVRAGVTVDPKPPTIEHRTFDPAHPPPEMPPLKGSEAALTESKFDCRVGMKYQVVAHKRGADGCVSTLMIQSIQATIQLKVIIWLPMGATAKLIAHEEGHRRIAEQVYADGQQVAWAIGASMEGKNVSGKGPDFSGADQSAAESSAHQFCDTYLTRTCDVAQHVGDVYDALTGHGIRAEPAEDEAIRQAFKQVATTNSPH